MIDLSIVIVSFNTKNILRDCLLSLTSSLNSSELIDAVEVIIVDNASYDGSYEMVKKEFSAVSLIRNKTNLGFGAANNIGVKRAKGRYILLLNSDTLLNENSISVPLEFIKSDNSIGAIGIKILNPNKTIQQSVGYFPNLPRVISWMLFFDDLPLYSAILPPYHVNSGPFYNQEHQVDWLTGAFILIRKDVFTKSGGFDEKMFMYVEEIDLFYRIKMKNMKILYTPSASVIHYKGASSGGRSAGIIEEFKGLIYFYNKHHSKFSSYILRMVIYFGALLRILVFAIIGDSEKKKSYIAYVKMA